MDDIVKAALAKWPNVPHCYGWLGLDARGNWYMRDDRCQAAGPFARAEGDDRVASKGSLLKHEKLIEFIHRNYAADEQGQWFFQNGPQRVYVELENTPFIWRVQPDGRVWSHTGLDAGEVRQSLLDEQGRLYLVTAMGLGLVHTSDMALAADAVESGRWVPEPVQWSALPVDQGFVRSPQRLQARETQPVDKT
ncbi:MAG TPA: DUF2946 domain-containing protein [Hydrogenophaga sp.]|jgi:hypothetical protein|uniref:DUF2946 family protein n=1 Tax=Hydrogenophaga sp. TaxID=1904254 RepID=UPI0008CE5CED|nr:DUF2946 family protein [Hydrogenophaga sp.]MBU4181056.1 DUF2946 family protein [Gammaproteobacteria bacterium]OGA73611.1 MAG: hypothetical protein A2X73_14595 [Burkholderiales bacterium GWE1_65_30]OGA92105.1 MAG: hypothetical protein A2X72_08845 [Burkholderiales bacterium GWF1_66_17]OGB28292.1 MAG: hypothetical protein A3I16_06880 [Burkholderiales bacterium RIFCSPLOWO2_02_FULL_66_35]OGB38119.1 MAG: hypothetical protein A3B67_12270 [Burkholderiales bacterium RIFCSPHIGHO2_02_FULL_66_10]